MNHNTNYIVENIGGTSGSRYSWGSGYWLKWYRELTRSTAEKCARNGCRSNAVHGAHVRITDKRCAGVWYIVPLCSSCNNPNNGEGMHISRNIVLLSLEEVRGAYHLNQLKK